MTLHNNIILSGDRIRLELAGPGTYYKGTRFDWSGVFRRIELDGIPYCNEWFDLPDPMRHDNVCGPSEEFYGCVGYDSAAIGETFLKVGVGELVRDSDEPYDWFHLYEIADPGTRTLETYGDKVVFTHEMPGAYTYSKTVGLTGEDSFRIFHTFLFKREMQLRQYCHNFFTFGLNEVGPERSVEWEVPFIGTWRPDSVNNASDGRTICITAPMEKGRKCYIEGHPDSGSDGYGFILKASDRSVSVKCSLPMEKFVLWSNHRVFCPEPYIKLCGRPSETLEWTIDYNLK